MGKSNALVPLVFAALFWNGIVGLFDGVIATQYMRTSVAATSFEPVEALITESEVSRQSSSDGATFSANVQYEYDFAGVHYLGDRYSYMEMSTSEYRFAERVCKKYPKGQTVTAYVDPEEPSEATLEINADSFPAAILLFLMPFNCIGLLLIGAVISQIMKRRDGGLEDQLRARYLRVDTDEHVVFGPSRMPAPAVFATSACALSFLSMFAVLVPFGFDAPMKIVLSAIVGCLALSAVITWRHVKSGRSPEKFLHVDYGRGTFSFPANAPGVPLDSIQSILSESESTNLTINDVKQYRHTFGAETSDGVQSLFEVRSGMDEGDEILNLLRSELLRG
jgi:hypothetical protein